MKKLLPSQYAKVLFELTKDLKKAELETAVKEFVAFLASEHVLKKAPYIMREYEALAKKAEGITELTVMSATELDEKVKKEIEGAFSGKVEMETIVYPEILGGVIVRAGNTILDGSVKTKIATLKRTLLTS